MSGGDKIRCACGRVATIDIGDIMACDACAKSEMGSGADKVCKTIGCGKPRKVFYRFCPKCLNEREKERQAQTNEIRAYTTGATRDTAEGKLDYARGLSPVCEKSYLEYLAKHREQSDGNMREFDNWKKGMPIVDALSSLTRHRFEVWEIIEPYIHIEDNDKLIEILVDQQVLTEVCENGKRSVKYRPALEVLEDALNANKFNANVMLRELLTRRTE